MFDEVSTTAASESLSETTLLTELERQAEAELRWMLISRARRERAESAAFTAAALADPAGMRVTAPVLWNRCSAAINLARKATRVPLSEDDFRDAVADLVTTAIRNDSAPLTMRPASFRPYWHRRRTADPVQALFHAPYGTPRADARTARLERDATEFGATLPRAGRCAMPWLQATANGRLKDRAALHATSGVTSTGELDSAAEAGPGRYLADLTAADIIRSTGLDSAPVQAALRSAVDGESLADVGAELGWTHATARKNAQRGRDVLRDKWDVVSRAILADPADPLDAWAIGRSILTRSQCERPDRAGATYSAPSAAQPDIRTARDVIRRMDALERAVARVERYALNTYTPAESYSPGHRAEGSIDQCPAHPAPGPDWQTRKSVAPTGSAPSGIIGSSIQALGRPTDWPTREQPDGPAPLPESYTRVAIESDAREQRPSYVSHTRNLPAPSASS